MRRQQTHKIYFMFAKLTAVARHATTNSIPSRRRRIGVKSKNVYLGTVGRTVNNLYRRQRLSILGISAAAAVSMSTFSICRSRLLLCNVHSITIHMHTYPGGKGG